MRESLSVTDEKAYWVMPSEYKKVQSGPIPAISMSFLDKDVESLPLLRLSSGYSYLYSAKRTAATVNLMA